MLPGFGVAGQHSLTAASVLVVGAGGLGSPVIEYLAAAGVGRLGLVDDDVVDVSNLQRQVVHGQGQLGVLKVDSARARVAELNPGVQVETISVRLEAGNALEMLRGYDLVVDGSDNFATRYLVTDACEMLGIPLVWGAVLRFSGQVCTFWPGRGPGYRDLFPEPPDAEAAPSCAEVGVLGPLCGVIGSTMAVEALKLLAGVGEPLLGRLQNYDALSGQWRTVRFAQDPDRAPATELSDDYAEICAAPGPKPVGIRLEDLTPGSYRLVDIRPDAVESSIQGALVVPRSEVESLLSEDSLLGFDVVLVCATGSRSAAAALALRAAGNDRVFSLEGGARNL